MIAYGFDRISSHETIRMAIPVILPRNHKPDMLLGKAGTTKEAKFISSWSCPKLTAFLANLDGRGC